MGLPIIFIGRCFMGSMHEIHLLLSNERVHKRLKARSPAHKITTYTKYKTIKKHEYKNRDTKTVT